MPHLVDQHGLDTALARVLLDRGLLDVSTLQGLLASAREERHTGGTLARAILEHGLLREAQVEAALTHLAPEPRGWREGARIDDYLLVGKIGVGGMGLVFLAEHTQTKGRYALKTVGAAADADLRERFRREAQAQAAVDAHPNVVRLHSLGEACGQLYLVMDHAPGGDLESRLCERPLPVDDAARLVRDLCQGLAHVHGQGVLHRDLKAANVLFDERGTPKLVDFGIARVSWEGSLTATGDLMGTPAAMAPEQARGLKEIDERTDVYGMGALLYRCLTGSYPFAGTSVFAILANVCESPLEPPSAKRSEVPPALDRICLRAMSRAPDARYPTAAAFGEALDAYLRGEPEQPSAPRGRWLALAAAALVLALGARVVLSTGSPPAASSAPTTPIGSSVQPTPAPGNPKLLARLVLELEQRQFASARVLIDGSLSAAEAQRLTGLLETLLAQHAKTSTQSLEDLTTEAHLRSMLVALDPSRFFRDEDVAHWSSAVAISLHDPNRSAPLFSDMAFLHLTEQTLGCWTFSHHKQEPGEPSDAHLAFAWGVLARARRSPCRADGTIAHLLEHMKDDLEDRADSPRHPTGAEGLLRLATVAEELAGDPPRPGRRALRLSAADCFMSAVTRLSKLESRSDGLLLELAERGLKLNPANLSLLYNRFALLFERNRISSVPAAIAYLEAIRQQRHDLSANQEAVWAEFMRRALPLAARLPDDQAYRLGAAAWPFPPFEEIDSTLYYLTAAALIRAPQPEKRAARETLKALAAAEGDEALLLSAAAGDFTTLRSIVNHNLDKAKR